MTQEMMTLSASGSSGDTPGSGAFELLDSRLQRWIWDHGWSGLRDAQEQAIQSIMRSDRDVIICAATAAGKTEAAFLPICSRIAKQENPGISVLCVSPLKALINDQFDRLEDMCERVEIPVWHWHGDVDKGHKDKLLAQPSGVLFLTPESLESFFVNRFQQLPRLFAGLEYIVIDELHSFIGSERGVQLASLLYRIEQMLDRDIPRIGLSATLGEPRLAAEFMRRNRPDQVEIIISQEDSRELQLQLRGYLEPATIDTDEEGMITEQHTAEAIIAEHLYSVLRGHNNLAFANSRRAVELYADLLRRRCAEERVPVEFLAHHGSLSKELRQDAEEVLKDKTRPSTIFCTSTLELGIDVGSVKSVAQIGSPPSVASLRQRLGRSGRNIGDPAILRLYISEQELVEASPAQDRLRVSLVQTMAMVDLLLTRWYEPPPKHALHLSTFIQQLLSHIAASGGARAQQLWEHYSGPGSPFANIDSKLFAGILRSLGERQVIEQMDNGLLLLGDVGENIVSHYSFYTAFATPEEFRLITGSHTLGSLPINDPLVPGSYIIFGGTRWAVLQVDTEAKVILVEAAGGGKPPAFESAGGHGRHTRVREAMLRIYQADDAPLWLDGKAQALLAEARGEFRRLGLSHTRMLSYEKGVLCFPWCSDVGLRTLALWLSFHGLAAVVEDVALWVRKATIEQVQEALRRIEIDPPDLVETVEPVADKLREKHDWMLSDELQAINHAIRELDTGEGLHAVRSLQQNP